ETLAGLLETPAEETNAYVLFAHCFTCGKDLATATRISRSLVARGYAVLRFDFTGLGNSDGDFSNTNFSSNVQDLLAAADFLRQQYSAPALLIGHSLGGAAILKAAEKIPESQAVVTIGAPADAAHVSKQFACDIEAIEQQGQAEVDLAGRKFTIKKQFIDDIQEQNMTHLKSLKKALLVFHSPLDATVPIAEAQKIYQQAKHPKNFISLDQADHLLTRKEDAEYVADIIASWANRYLDRTSTVNHKSSGIERGKVVVTERNQAFTQTVTSDGHFWLADEPVSVGGDNLGPDPYEHLLAALGACTNMTLRMFASRKGWPLENVRVSLSHGRRHGDDCLHCDEQHPQIDVIDRTIVLTGDLNQQQRQRLLEIADRCPVHKTLHNKILVNTELR
ncbi:MAG: bifunctional alpha/beta hydrolase/OsmC family protein, partial [Motiliproteus sp.]